MIKRFTTMQRFAKPVQWVVLMVAAHMMLNVQSQTEITGILGDSIILNFTFPSHAQVKNNSHIVIHQKVIKDRKVAEYTNGNEEGVFYVHPENKSVSWHITSVTWNNSGLYWASVVSNIATKSHKVQVTIQEVSTVASSPGNNTDSKNKSWKLQMDALIVTIVAVSAIVIMAAVIPCIIWRLFGVKDKQEQQNQQSSNPIVQETASSMSLSATSVVYSVLDFPKRASALSDVLPNDAEYANICYAEKM